MRAAGSPVASASASPLNRDCCSMTWSFAPSSSRPFARSSIWPSTCSFAISSPFARRFVRSSVRHLVRSLIRRPGRHNIAQPHNARRQESLGHMPEAHFSVAILSRAHSASRNPTQPTRLCPTTGQSVTERMRPRPAQRPTRLPTYQPASPPSSYRAIRPNPANPQCYTVI